jgi:regulator of RNase E activity RraA
MNPENHAVAPASSAPAALSDECLELVLRWAVIEHGTAELSERLAPEARAADPPAYVLPPMSAFAGKVVLLRRSRPPDGSRPASSFAEVRRRVTGGCVLLVRCEPGIGAAFGSNLALLAAARRAQAVVTDGCWRDTSRLQSVGIPLGGNGTDPTRPAGCPMVIAEREELFGVRWSNGDWLVRDADGVLRLDAVQAQRTVAELIEPASGELAALLSSTDEVA